MRFNEAIWSVDDAETWFFDYGIGAVLPLQPCLPLGHIQDD